MLWTLLGLGGAVVVLVIVLSQWSRISGRVTAKSGMTAEQMLGKLKAMNARTAQWEEIWEQINPDGNAVVQQLLVDFRGPYMFAPHAGINVLKIGCERAIAASATADREAAVRAAMLADDQVVRPE